VIERHLFHFEYTGDGAERWSHDADGHRFEIFWTPLARSVGLVAGQDVWLTHVYDSLASGRCRSS
jgi:hypothetical protein